MIAPQAVPRLVPGTAQRRSPAAPREAPSGLDPPKPRMNPPRRPAGAPQPCCWLFPLSELPPDDESLRLLSCCTLPQSGSVARRSGGMGAASSMKAERTGWREWFCGAGGGGCGFRFRRGQKGGGGRDTTAPAGSSGKAPPCPARVEGAHRDLERRPALRHLRRLRRAPLPPGRHAPAEHREVGRRLLVVLAKVRAQRRLRRLLLLGLLDGRPRSRPTARRRGGGGGTTAGRGGRGRGTGAPGEGRTP